MKEKVSLSLDFATSFFAHLVHVVSDELHGLLERIRITAARIYHDSAERDIWQQPVILVYLIDGVEHRFESLNAFLFLNRAARIVSVGAVVFVHWENASQHYVTGHPNKLSIIAVATARVD
jgi:hypothetical protein